ncbi:AMP-binding protein [Brevibacterium samyangense]|uniref:AMP-binding protein n=1 Tax=Brevibacterium samyangense TaxID=366888 RepID=A0ABP5EM46_9MICO
MFSTPAEIYENAFRNYATLVAVRDDTPGAASGGSAAGSSPARTSSTGTDGPSEYTYRDLHVWSDAVMDQLDELGVQPGDVVSMFARNRVEWPVLETAIARFGATRSPANYMSALDTIVYQLGYARTKVLVADHDLGAELLPKLAADPLTRDITVVQLRDPEGRLLPGAIPLVDQPPAGTAPHRESVKHDPQGLSTINFTGGTTGKPKAVAHTRASSAAALYIQIVEAEIATSERMLVMSPLAHSAGAFTSAGIGRGANVRILDGFDAERTVDLLESDGITWTFMVPTMIYRILDVVEARRTGAGEGTSAGEGASAGGATPHDQRASTTPLDLRTLVYGAAPMSPTRLEQGLRLFGRVFVQLFGQTEAPQFCTSLGKLDHDLARPELLASCGNPTLFTQVQVADEDGNFLAPGELGEIVVKTPFALREYLGNPEATAEKFFGDWVRTGDMGVRDENGYFYLKDRRNDMIISGGFNVYSREVEDAVTAHPQVAQAAVIGIPHEDWGEAVHAYVVSRDGTPEAPHGSLTELEVCEFTRGKVANYARPKSVTFVPDLPLTPFGKIDKKVLRAPHWENRTRAIG